MAAWWLAISPFVLCNIGGRHRYVGEGPAEGQVIISVTTGDGEEKKRRKHGGADSIASNARLANHFGRFESVPRGKLAQHRRGKLRGKGEWRVYVFWETDINTDMPRFNWPDG